MDSRKLSERLLGLALLIVLPLSSAAAASATEVKVFRTDTREAVAGGTLDALSVDPLGTLELARRVERLAMPEEPFVFTAAAHPEGWVLGTGSSGKVLLVRRSGAVEELFATEEPEVFAVAVGGDGTVYAGSSPEGKVYRLGADGEAEEVFSSGDAYIWDLDFDAQGRLLVATGVSGRLYRVAPDGTADVLFESPDGHVRAVAVLGDRILVGTAGQGLVLELRPDQGKKGDQTVVRTLYDAAHPEVLAFAPGENGTVYAAVLASEASQVDLSASQAAKKKENGGEGEAENEAAVTVSSAQATAGSRGSGFTGPRSLVLEITPDGRARELEAFQDETVHALAFFDGDLWIGTGQEGHLYRRRADGALVLERDLEERQVVALVVGADAAAMTTNAAAVYHLPGGSVEEGTYTSAVLDASEVARFGVFRWRGELPAGSSVAIEARSGMSDTPDATWTGWRAAGGGREVHLGELAHGRYVQWRAKLTGEDGHGPRILSSELSYRQENQKPEIAKFEVLAPGEVLVPQNFNPQNQLYEPWSPNRDGIFTTIRAERETDNSRLKSLWKKGFRSLRWEASDKNDDELVYRLDVRRDGTEGWIEIASDVDQTFYSFDATVLPDGVYRFRLTASDERGQPHGETLETAEVSEPVVIDHTPPRVVTKKRAGGVVEVELADGESPVRDAVASVDAAAWEDVEVSDGLLDGRHETVRVAVPEGARLVLLRITDAAFNTVTVDLLGDGS